MKEELIIYKDPKSPIAEVFRILRTNLQFMTANKGLKTVLITSSMPGEGKSWVSANLALAFAQEKKKVIIVDADMRKGRLHDIFNVEKNPGLSNYLSGITDLKENEKLNILNYIKKTKIDNLYMLSSGDVPPNPSELLVSEKANSLIEQLRNMFDIVIFDGTPSLIVTDAIILSRKVDATLIITAHKTTKMGDVAKIKKSIENVGGKIAGIVINKIPISARKYEHSYYYGNKDNKEDRTVTKTEEKENVQIEEEQIQKEINEEVLKQMKQFQKKQKEKEATKEKEEIKKKEKNKKDTKENKENKGE